MQNDLGMTLNAAPAPFRTSGYEGVGLKLTFTAPRLNKKNYIDWAAKTENLLEIQGVWSIVSGDEPEPGPRSAIEKLLSWRQHNGIAKAILGGLVDENEFRLIRSIKKASEAWTKLRDIH
jgi:hypothetical protein